jgi:hypothetical protein
VKATDEASARALEILDKLEDVYKLFYSRFKALTVRQVCEEWQKLPLDEVEAWTVQNEANLAIMR